MNTFNKLLRHDEPAGSGEFVYKTLVNGSPEYALHIEKFMYVVDTSISEVSHSLECFGVVEYPALRGVVRNELLGAVYAIYTLNVG